MVESITAMIRVAGTTVGPTIALQIVGPNTPPQVKSTITSIRRLLLTFCSPVTLINVITLNKTPDVYTAMRTVTITLLTTNSSTEKVLQMLLIFVGKWIEVIGDLRQ